MFKEKTILVTVNTTWNIYNFRLGLINKLKEYGYRVVVLTPTDYYVKYLKIKKIEFQHISINPKGVNPIEDLILFKNYFFAIKKIQPDIVLSYTIKPNIYASIACKFLKIPVVNNVSGLGTLFIKRSIFSRIAMLLYRFAFNNSSWLFFQNEFDKNLFVKLRLVHEQRTSVLYGSGVDLERFNCIRQTNLGLRFLFVGRLIGDKGIREFIEAANKLSKTNPLLEFLIVGEIGYRNRTSIPRAQLEKWLKNPQIKFLGKQDDMEQVYRSVDIIVLPSYREGLSKSLIEASAMRLPIITTNVPGCKEVVEEGRNGFLCKVKEANDLLEKMDKMIQLTEKQRLDMGNYSREKAEKEFDEKIVIKEYINKINDILGGNYGLS